MRSLLALVLASALSLPASALSAPEFAPSPKQAYEGFVGINPPRAEVPVGALWINGYGPTGQGATPDNLETVRSLNGLSIGKNLQLALSLGILQLLGVDPKLRDHYIARFADLSIVRVKDLNRLAGPKGEPRIIEALKAGSVTVSTEAGMGLSGQTQGWHQLPVEGSTANERTRAYSIEARDMFFAIRVATPELTSGPERELRISSDGKSARIDDFLVVISRTHCAPDAAGCQPKFGIAKLNTQTVTTVDAIALSKDGVIRLGLPVPIADDQGGLFDHLALRWVPSCAKRAASRCRDNSRLIVHYEGTRTADLKSTEAKGW